MLKRRILRAAFDESGNGKEQTLCVTAFSFINEDMKQQTFPTKRNETLLEKLDSPYRDYRFTLFNRKPFIEKLGENTPYNYISYTCPLLIKSFIQTSREFDKLELCIDGEVYKKDEHLICDSLSHYFPQISFKACPKKVFGKGKGYYFNQPFLVVLADLKSHNLYHNYRRNFNQLMSFSKFVDIGL